MSIYHKLKLGKYGWYGSPRPKKKAFDTMDHSIVFLEYMWLENKWFGDYLSCRLHTSEVNGVNSDLLPMTTGALQGSFIGPLLLITYLNYLLSCLGLSEVNSLCMLMILYTILDL